MVDIVVQVVDERGALPTSQCDVTYNSRNRPATISENGWTLELSYGSGLQREKSVLKNGATTVCTTYFISKDSELEIKPSSTRYIDYIYAEGRIVALHVHNTTANADSLYYVQTDLLGSWDRIVNGNRQVVQRSHFDPWGNRMSATNWPQAQDGSTFAFHRGFTGHEHYDRFGIINMNARLYDPVLGRFFSPDPQVQSPFSTQGYNRYSYCGNNPVMYVDEDGESFLLIAACVGAAIGMYSGGVLANGGEFKPWEWDYSSGRTWGYMLGGAIVGGLSGYAGAAIATSGIPFANTLSLVTSSFINSLGTNFYTGGMTPVSISFGFASYNITDNEWGWIFKFGNKWYENVGYGLGAMANLSDILMWFRPQKVDLVTQHGDKDGGHSSMVKHGTKTCVREKGTYVDPNKIISVGPNPNADGNWSWMDGINNWATYSSDDFTTWRQSIDVNINTIERYAGWLDKLEANGTLIYSWWGSSCVTHTSNALNLSGVFNIGIHPSLLNAQMYLWTRGVRPWTYAFYLNL